jgi:hypothetical protein
MSALSGGGLYNSDDDSSDDNVEVNVEELDAELERLKSLSLNTEEVDRIVDDMVGKSWETALSTWVKLDRSHKRATKIMAERMRERFPNEVAYDNEKDFIKKVILSACPKSMKVTYASFLRIKGRHTTGWSRENQRKILKLRKEYKKVNASLEDKFKEIRFQLFGDISAEERKSKFF